MSFLRVFRDVLHALEAAASIAAPIVKAVDPTIGALMMQATNTAVSIEAAITTPGSGAQRAAVVADTTSAALMLINGLLVSQGKPALPGNTAETVAGVTKTVVDTLNMIADTVQPKPKQ